MADLPVIEEPAKWNHSFSSIKTFLDCEFKYAVEKVAPWEDNEHSLRGRHIHDALEYWADLGFDPESYPSVLQVPGALSEKELQGWLDNVKEFAEGLIPLRQEFWIQQKLAGCRQKLVGKVDLQAQDADGEFLLDWKSVTSLHKKLTQTECDRSLQGRIYSGATGVRRFKFAYFTPNHRVEIVESEYTDRDIAEATEFVEHTCQQIERRWETQHWRKAFPGGLCDPRWCSSFATCYGTRSA